jgi:hypothetical protein
VRAALEFRRYMDQPPASFGQPVMPLPAVNLPPPQFQVSPLPQASFPRPAPNAGGIPPGAPMEWLLQSIINARKVPSPSPALPPPPMGGVRG